MWKKTSSIVNAKSEYLTKEEISSLNLMISKLNANLKHGRTVEEFKSYETAVEQMSKIIKDVFVMYNSFIIHTFNLTEKEVAMTRDDFCKAVAKICSKTYVVPSEFKTIPINIKVLETLQKEHKYLIDATINHSMTKTVETSNEKMEKRFVKPEILPEMIE